MLMLIFFAILANVVISEEELDRYTLKVLM